MPMYVDWEYYKIFYYVGEVSEFYQGRAGAGQQPAQHHPLDEPAGKAS